MSHVTFRAMDYAYREMCAALDTPRSLAAWLLYSNAEHEQLVKLTCRPSDYLEKDVQHFKDDYLVTEYLSKYKGLVTGIDLEDAAVTAFKQAEEQARLANRRIRTFIDSNGRETPLFLTRVILRAQELIYKCLGDDVPWRRIRSRFKWGKGSTFSLKGADVTLDAKLLEERISVTHEALPFLRAAMADDYAWLRARGLEPSGPCSLNDAEFCVVPGNRGMMVPKNAKTHRFIAAEPSGNIFLQLGVGGELRSCLKRVGIDLDRQDVNQDLARDALDLGLATVDLKQASDTVCREIVWLLLPYSWCVLLDALRSPQTILGEERLVLNKFSSMGNGFTFELETLLFWGLTQACKEVGCHRGRVSVYGDDIICPDTMERDLSSVLSFCGFTLNEKKSHFGGVFRESCGKHYFGGKDVSPIYQKDPIEGAERHRFVNRILYHAVDRGWRHGDVLLADRKLRFCVRLPALMHNSGRYYRIPIQGDPIMRSLDGGYACSYNKALFRYRNGSFGSLALRFIPLEFEANHGAIYATRLRRPESAQHDPVVLPASQRLVRSRNYLMLWVRKQQLRFATELSPFTGTVTRRDEGRLVRDWISWPEACTCVWV